MGDSVNEAGEDDDRRDEDEDSGMIRIMSPTFTLAKDEPVPVSVNFAALGAFHPSHEYDFWTEVRVPVKIPREIGVAAAILSIPNFNLGNIEEVIGTTATVFIGKLKIRSELMMRLEGLAQLAGIYKESKFRATVSASFGNYTFSHKLGVIDINQEGSGEGEVIMFDSFLKSFGTLATHLHDTGHFNISVSWEHCPLKENESKYFSRLGESLVSPEIQAIEGIVSLTANNGKAIKVSKGLLSASSSKFLAQFQNGWVEGASGMVVELPVYIDANEIIGEAALSAFVQFIGGHSLKVPMAVPTVALELLMPGQYNMIPEMESAMGNVLLFQPADWFDLATSIKLCRYVTQVDRMLRQVEEEGGGEGEDNKEMGKWKWNLLMLKALYNLKGKSKRDIEECSDAESLFDNNNAAAVDTFIFLISLV